MTTKIETSTTDKAMQYEPVLTTVFPCKIKIDGDEFTSEQVCNAFGYTHSQFMFSLAIGQIKERHGKVSDRYV